MTSDRWVMASIAALVLGLFGIGVWASFQETSKREACLEHGDKWECRQSGGVLVGKVIVPTESCVCKER